jgi:hypothetical protein
VIHRKMLGPSTAIALGALLAAVALAIAPASAAAAGPATDCGGWLKRAPTSIDPNALAYTFQCNWGITAYSVIATRQANDYNTIDDFDPDGLAYDTSGNPVSGVGFDCAGQIPGNGISGLRGRVDRHERAVLLVHPQGLEACRTAGDRPADRDGHERGGGRTVPTEPLACVRATVEAKAEEEDCEGQEH